MVLEERYFEGCHLAPLLGTFDCLAALDDAFNLDKHFIVLRYFVNPISILPDRDISFWFKVDISYLYKIYFDLDRKEL